MASSVRRNLLAVCSVIILCGFLGVLLGQRVGSVSSAEDSDVREGLRVFSQVYSVVEQNNADPVNPDKAIYKGAIPGMLHTLDPHSNFFDPKDFAGLREDQQGRYGGIGAQIGLRNDRIAIIAPMPGSPAIRAGLKAGDIIATVDGKSAENLNNRQVSALLKGPKGTTVRIAVLRFGSDKPLEFAVVRDEIPRSSVDLHFMIRPGIGYMHLTQFNETTEKEVTKALGEFGDIKGLVIDVRQNPGGLLSACVGIADKFLKKGSTIVSHSGRSSPEKIYRANHGNGGKEYPIVVIVNRYSASASEILAGALQDHDRGLIIGEDTFGKGLVQTVFQLSEGSGLALTTAKYYTPSGRLIQRDYAGVPDLEYVSNRVDNIKPNADREVKMTDSGRTVYGGGGIAPDVRIEAPKATRLQQILFQKYSFFNFAHTYMGSGRHVSKDFEVDEPIKQEFRKFLTEQHVAYTEPELLEIKDWVNAGIKSELILIEFGLDTQLKVSSESDPQILKAVELLPKAKELAENSKKIIAGRDGARGVGR